MDENTFRKIVEEVVVPIKKQLDDVTEKLGGVTEKLDDPDFGLVAINSRLDANTGAIIELEKTVKGYADMYKMNDSNIRKIEKRLEPIEKAVKVKVPLELHLESFAEAA